MPLLWAQSEFMNLKTDDFAEKRVSRRNVGYVRN